MRWISLIVMSLMFWTGVAIAGPASDVSASPRMTPTPAVHTAR